MLPKLRCTMALAALLPFVAGAAVHDAVNSLRAAGCGDYAAVDSALRHDRRLDGVAERLADGASAGDAIAASGYRAQASAWIRIRSQAGEAGVSRVLERRYCDIVADPGLHEVGAYRRGDTTWFVLATPLVDPGSAASEDAALRVVELINEARAGARRCGRERFSPAPPLARSAALARAAAAHAKDMAASGRFGHAGADGSMPADRVERAGYSWRAVAENVASGQPTPSDAVQTWLDSPGHCANLMDRGYTETGVAFVVDPASDRGIYWVQVFADPAP